MVSPALASVLLAGCAGWLAGARGAPGRARLRRIRRVLRSGVARGDPSPDTVAGGRPRGSPRSPVTVPSSLAARVPAALGVLAAVLVATDRSAVGVPLAILAVAVALPAHRRALDDQRARTGLARDVPRAADLMATCLDAGTPPGEAVAVVCEETVGPVTAALRPVAAALRAGTDPAAAWALAGGRRGDPLGRLGRAYVRGATTGAPLARSLRTVASDERTRTRTAAEAAARRAGVRAIGPLAACFLPAFLLLGVVPVVVGVASQVLRDLG